MNKAPNYRGDIVNSIIPYAERDPRLHVMVCDMGFGVTDKFRDRFPGRLYNVGIMEQGTVGIAAGMAMTGLVPIVYSIVNFLAFRAIEQVRNDVVLQGLNVKFIATGVNNFFRFLGKSHCCDEDDIRIMEMIGIKVYDPYRTTGRPFDDIVREWILDDAAGYIRV
ncbi:MAG TPA: transketolase [Spirochaetota bacterium]|nr:transketolase [Spirochaetota bacterium]HNT11656.1 transketolase [Spirochaetota bacterium]